MEIKCVNLVFAWQRRSHWSCGRSHHWKLLQQDIPWSSRARNCTAWWWKLCNTGQFYCGILCIHYLPREGSGLVIRALLCSLARCRNKRLNRGFVRFVLTGASFLCCSCFGCLCYFVSLSLVVSTSALRCLERLVSEMAYYVSSGTLNPTNPTHCNWIICRRTVFKELLNCVPLL